MRVRYTCTLNDCGDPYMAHNPKGGWVSATDYDTLATERDEWKRRCEELERRLDGLERFIAIAEGRDNG